MRKVNVVQLQSVLTEHLSSLLVLLGPHEEGPASVGRGTDDRGEADRLLGLLQYRERHMAIGAAACNQRPDDGTLSLRQRSHHRCSRQQCQGAYGHTTAKKNSSTQKHSFR